MNVVFDIENGYKTYAIPEGDDSTDLYIFVTMVLWKINRLPKWRRKRIYRHTIRAGEFEIVIEDDTTDN